jgi:quinol monooxygenase YgiN
VIILAGAYRIASGRKVEVEKAIATLVKATRGEIGCLAYSHAFDALDDHLVRVFEVFADEDALRAHRESPHMAAWRAGWSGNGLSDRDMKRYDIADWRVI